MSKLKTKKRSADNVLLPRTEFTATHIYQDYLELFSLFYSKGMKRPTAIGVGIFYILLFTKGLYFQFSWAGVLGVILGFLFFIPGIYYLRLIAYVSYLILRWFVNPTKFALDSESIKEKNKISFFVDTKWSSFTRFLYNDRIVIGVRKVPFLPSINILSFIPKRFLKKEEWDTLYTFIKSKETNLVNVKQPNRFIRWCLRILFVLFLELSFIFGFIAVMDHLRITAGTNPSSIILIILMIFITMYGSLLDFRRYSLKKNFSYILYSILLFVVVFLLGFVFYPANTGGKSTNAFSQVENTKTVNVSRTGLENQFEKMSSEAKWDINKPLYWGYYFYDSDKFKLEIFSKELEKNGLQVYEIRKSAEQESNKYLLYAYEYKVHTPEALLKRCMDLSKLAVNNRIEEFDGWEAGKEPL